MATMDTHQNGARGPSRIWPAAVVVAGVLVIGAITLAVTRADALLLDLGRFAGCL